MLSSGIVFAWILASFRHIFFGSCLYLSTPLLLAVFGNSSIRKWFLASTRISNLAPFQRVLWTLFQVSFFIRCCYIFDAIWGSIWHHFQKKTFRKSLQKKGYPLGENPGLRWLPETPPRVRITQTRNNNSSSNCCSNSCPWL